MSESKTGQFGYRFPDNGGGNGERRNKDVAFDRSHASDRLAPEARQGNSFEAYRRWLTRVQAPGSQRVPLDPSLYTWKGYRNWSDRVRRDWKAED